MDGGPVFVLEGCCAGLGEVVEVELEQLLGRVLGPEGLIEGLYELDCNCDGLLGECYRLVVLEEGEGSLLGVDRYLYVLFGVVVVVLHLLYHKGAG